MMILPMIWTLGRPKSGRLCYNVPVCKDLAGAVFILQPWSAAEKLDNIQGYK